MAVDLIEAKIVETFSVVITAVVIGAVVFSRICATEIEEVLPGVIIWVVLAAMVPTEVETQLEATSL